MEQKVMIRREVKQMNLRTYMKLDINYKKGLENYYIRNMLIAAVGLFLFCFFIIAGAFGMMDKLYVFNIYLLCFLSATSLYFWPLIQVRENFYIASIFKKFRNAPINKRLFIRAKLLLLIRFSVLLYIPVQIAHFIGLKSTETSQLSITGFWPLAALLVSLLFQYLYMRFRARDLNTAD